MTEQQPTTPRRSQSSPINNYPSFLTATKGMDYVTILAVAALAIIACFALYFGNGEIAGTAAGAIAGIVTRLNK